MNYKLEKDLQMDLAIRDLGILVSSTQYIRREVAIGECIPDVVIVGFPDNFGIINYPKKISNRHIYILWLIKKSKQISSYEIANKSFQRIDKVNRIIKDLVDSGAVIKTENGDFRVQDTIASLQTEVVAIEAKLSKWNQALEQAKRYQEFADKVIVAIDADKTPKRKSVIEKFIEQNIGLCAISPNSLDWIVYPRYAFVESFEKECLVTSALSPSTHTLWERR